ncbi:uncharacterized protein LOC131158007 isoform X3 [Malania oleifera]|uniref:uncharacterized protein LOC131158007 isoform X3 n=1 Tax=Malania oleifera TaxID=397392 RepID=UPI0025AE0297|nr:uncharacterized protein LOC131158007 isoform X3 [Malania oleifera]XP_057968537.1 uncharacterized protein LOC131158007 isoform X3 [Malania oleifera]
MVLELFLEVLLQHHLKLFLVDHATIMFLYLLLKVGIIQCIGKSLCKMCWAACETYWFILEDITCFLWHKLTNVKRVNRRRRRRFQDIELGSSSSGESESLDNFYSWSADRKQKPVRRKNQLQNSLHFARQHPKCRSGSHHHHHHHHHHHERLKTGASLSVRVKGSSQRVRSLKKLQIRRVHNPRRKRVTFKRRLR